MAEKSKTQNRLKRISDLSVIAPLIGLILLTPPLIGLFAHGQTLFDAPLILVYIFGIWLTMIVVAALLGRALNRETDS